MNKHTISVLEECIQNFELKFLSSIVNDMAKTRNAEDIREEKLDLIKCGFSHCGTVFYCR